jgi:hypothetical protein
MPKQPLAEVFGFPISNSSPEATRYRKRKLCPFGNKVPNCTKDKADSPLGVCSILDNGGTAITCPVRFRQEWIIAEDAADFFFTEDENWTSLTEVRLNDKNGKSAGNIDVVLVSYDQFGKVTGFGSLEIQAVYISGNVRNPFDHFMKNPVKNATMDWAKESLYPRPDYLSSSRKRLAPQLLFKGGILHAWGKKMAVALDRGFYATLPKLPIVPKERADIAWLIYDLELDNDLNKYKLVRDRIEYSTFNDSLIQITQPEIGNPETFIALLQEKLDQKLSSNPPDTSTIEVNL